MIKSKNVFIGVILSFLVSMNSFADENHVKNNKNFVLKENISTPEKVKINVNQFKNTKPYPAYVVAPTVHPMIMNPTVYAMPITYPIEVAYPSTLIIIK